jgi:hypothetical protein
MNIIKINNNLCFKRYHLFFDIKFNKLNDEGFLESFLLFLVFGFYVAIYLGIFIFLSATTVILSN